MLELRRVKLKCMKNGKINRRKKKMMEVLTIILIGNSNAKLMMKIKAIKK